MLKYTNPDGTLTPWGAQHQIGLLVKDPAGKVARLLGFDLDDICLVEYVEPFIVTELYSHQLRPHPIPLTPKTAYVGQWIRLIDKPHLIGQIKEIEYRNGGHGAYIYFSPSVRNMYYLSRLEALPPHAQDTPNLNQDETTN